MAAWSTRLSLGPEPLGWALPTGGLRRRAAVAERRRPHEIRKPRHESGSPHRSTRGATPMLLNEAIAIPTEIQQGDLVFRLADAEDNPKATLDSYVVTDQLLESFVAAVGLIRSAVDDGVS